MPVPCTGAVPLPWRGRVASSGLISLNILSKSRTTPNDTMISSLFFISGRICDRFGYLENILETYFQSLTVSPTAPSRPAKKPEPLFWYSRFLQTIPAVWVDAPHARSCVTVKLKGNEKLNVENLIPCWVKPCPSVRSKYDAMTCRYAVSGDFHHFHEGWLQHSFWRLNMQEDTQLNLHSDALARYNNTNPGKANWHEQDHRNTGHRKHSGINKRALLLKSHSWRIAFCNYYYCFRAQQPSRCM